ncbi:hypothetical protein D5S18_20755 [Nocardia panacis]|uniref:YvlB/LiaX N-terminal domain-containing protein n=1 Tax=Nocardia panacis TaxID=2340916 RepID=A0A3A4K573_9NOCA|nr:hypothetical protein [Nocardia panacis]RJO73621.1 hypothetical protein D5S18_20755 [Nocardia panacis]
MNEQRRRILEMLAEGKITADEAERLIDALERVPPQAPQRVERGAKPKYLRVVVTENAGGAEPGRVNIRIPLQLLRAGVRLTSLVPMWAVARLNAEFKRAGISVDLTELKPQHLEELIDQLDDLVVDVDQLDDKVQVYCE